MKTRQAVAALSVLSIGLLAACGGDDDDSAEDTAAPEGTTAEGTSAPGGTTAEGTAPAGEAVCPENIVFQTDWYHETEHGGTYQLIGTGGTADKTTVSYSGPIQPQYAVGGIQTVTIRTVNFDKQNAATLLDGEADFAYIGMGDVIANSGADGVDLVAIAKTLDKDPQMVMWDPAQLDISEPADIATTGVPVRHFPNAAYIDYMIGAGIMTEDQDDPNYDGSDAEFVARNGNLIQQGFVSNEVYKYENEIAWKDGAPAPVDYFTVGDLGFDNYPAAITMLRSHAEELDECLKLFVPVMQQAWVDFVADPKPIQDLMIDVNVTHDGFWTLSEALNEAAIAKLHEEGMLDNSPDGTYCSFDEAKVQALYDIMKPIMAEQDVIVADDISGLFTNDYCAGAPGMP